MNNIAVIYAPFQTPSLRGYHEETIRDILKDHNITIITLPVNRVPFSKNAPLDFTMRMEMIEDRFIGKVLIVPVTQKKYLWDQTNTLEQAVIKTLSDHYIEYNPQAIHFFSDRTQPPLYWLTARTNFLYHEVTSRNFVIKNPYWPITDECDSMELFRRGVIYGLNKQFPINYPTVDIAVSRVFRGKLQYLLAKKPGERGWRFAGGFKDRGDVSLEFAVLREGGEELLRKGVNPNEVFTKPLYICSMNVNDWRYRDNPDGIITTFFEINFLGTDDQLEAGDDLANGGMIQWWDLEAILDADMEGEHVNLLHELLKFKGYSNA